jgi:uncharacterized LabA/DUF88 family protein
VPGEKVSSKEARKVSKMAFQPKTNRIEKLSKLFPYVVKEFEEILDSESSIYLDFANVRSWSEKIGWHIDLNRLHQLYSSFSCSKKIRFYYGTMEGDPKSEQLIKEATAIGYAVKTKPVKRIRISIDATSVSAGSPDILRNFIARPLLESLSVKHIEDLNGHLKVLNGNGTRYFEDLKCNFDVEIGTDMMLDMHNKTENFLLWSCDSDFADIALQLLEAGKKVVIFGIGGRIARELNELQPAGLRVYEVKRLKEFLCWPRELDPKFK